MSVDWGALATLATGVLAVGAAWMVGRSQLQISSKQNEILDRQTHLAELSLRHDLFERRHALYSDAREFLLHILQHASYPSRELESKFLQAISLSRFLFPDAVHDRLEEIWKEGLKYGLLKSEMQAIWDRERHWGDDNPAKEAAMNKWFYERFAELPVVFGDSMRLA